MNKYTQFYGRHFLRIELLLAILVTGAGALWACYGGAPVIIGAVKNNHASIYGALASVDGSLLGFAITTVSIVLGFMSTERFATIRAHPAAASLWKTFRSTIRVLAVATVVSLLALVLDRDSSPSLSLLILCAGLQLLATLRVARCIWILEKVTMIMMPPARRSSAESIR